MLIKFFRPVDAREVKASANTHRERRRHSEGKVYQAAQLRVYVHGYLLTCV